MKMKSIVLVELKRKLDIFDNKEKQVCIKKTIEHIYNKGDTFKILKM